MRVEQELWYYTIDELGRFHSEWDEPAIVVNDYLKEKEDWVYEPVSWYKARYENGKFLRSERNSGEVFISNDE